MATYSTDNFIETKEYATITYGGWDGKSYNGEPCRRKVYTHPAHPGKQFVRAYMKGERCYHVITDKLHPVSGERLVEFHTYFSKD